MKIGLILSNDWEVFGDGSGDYFVVQHEPLEECLRVVENHGARMTVMAEVGQQWGHKKLGERESWAADVAEAWESILQETLRRGGDVQLHLHPQWLGAEYRDGKWDLKMEKWAIGRLASDEAGRALSSGKEYLETILRPVKPDYSCHSFRAGAYCIQPSGHIIDILLRLGFKCDVSVTKGMRDADFYDYRDAYSNAVPWFTSRDVRYKSTETERSSLLEIPIYSFGMLDSLGMRAVLGKSRSRDMLYRMNFRVPYEPVDQHWFAERDRIRAERYPVQNRPYQGPMHKIKSLISSPEGVMMTVLGKTMVQLDYDYLPANVFVKGVEKILTSPWGRKHANDDIVLPVMSSGHVKNMHNGDNLNRILEAVNRRFKDQVVHWTLDDAVRYWTQPQHAKVLG